MKITHQHGISTYQKMYTPAWNQYVPENAQSCTALYCHVLPKVCTSTAKSTYLYVLVRTRTYFLSFICSSTYWYVPVCTDMRKLTKSTYRYIHHKSTSRNILVRTGTYQYVPPYTRCTGFQMRPAGSHGGGPGRTQAQAVNLPRKTHDGLGRAQTRNRLRLGLRQQIPQLFLSCPLPPTASRLTRI
jgi:hypothetical protein